MKFLIDRLLLTTKFMFLIFFLCAVVSKAAVIKWNNSSTTNDFMEPFVHFAGLFSSIIVRLSIKQNSSTEPEFKDFFQRKLK